MENFPKIPGFNFELNYKEHYGFPHSLDFVNGIRLCTPPVKSIGDEPVADDSIAHIPDHDTALYDPILTYGRLRHPRVEPFRPHYVHYDKVVLTFHGFFRQNVIESVVEQQRIRYVNVMYFMEDDTITIMEPTIPNCGYPQGRIVRRSRIPKNNYGGFITWKDLNIGIDLKIFGVVYHLTDCDQATREFMRSQGIILNEVEERPSLPEPPQRPTTAIPTLRITPRATSDIAKVHRSIKYSGKVLTFNCLTTETDQPTPQYLTFKMYYFLEDDTVAIKELKENQEGRDYFPMFLKRTRIRKINQMASNMNLLSHAEYNNEDSSEYYNPNDFRVGQTLFIFGREFLLTDCDAFTRNYYADILKNPQPDKVNMRKDTRSHSQMAIPEYLGFGTPEDSLASFLSLVPKAPRKDIVKYLMYANKYLRFGCILQNTTAEDLKRQFVLKFSLSDGTISIFEPPVRNSGIQGGRFLSPQLIVKPGGNRDIPEYYTSKDFFIGAILLIHNHKFRLITADLAVYHHMLDNPELFSEEALNGVREYLLTEHRLDPELREKLVADTEKYHTEQPKKETQIRTEMVNMDQCLDNVHLYENRDENEKCFEANEKEAKHLQHNELIRYPKLILPYHEKEERPSPVSRSQSAGRRVTFEN